MSLKLAILQAEKTNPIIATKVCDIKNLYLSFFLNAGIKIDFFDIQNNHYPVNLEEYDGYLITGSKYHAYGNDVWIETLKSFIHENKTRKFIGICFGCQVLAEALGGKVKKSCFGWNLGIKSVNLVSQIPWLFPYLSPYKIKLNAIFNHQDIVVQLPDNAMLLAASEDCPVQMYTINNNILAMQFHPEFSEQYQKELMLNNTHIDPALVRQAQQSYLENSIDNKLILRWIINFLQKESSYVQSKNSSLILE